MNSYLVGIASEDGPFLVSRFSVAQVDGKLAVSYSGSNSRLGATIWSEKDAQMIREAMSVYYPETEVTLIPVR